MFSYLPRVMPTLLLAFTASLVGQAPNSAPPAVPAAPPQTNVPQRAPLDPNLPTIFIVGDSTAHNGVDMGWGEHFAHYFDTTRVNIANRAIGARSARLYYNEGAWDRVLAEMKPGDYVLFQMGHNDGGGPLTANFRNPIGEGKGIGEESVDIPITRPFASGPLVGKTVETVHTYGWYNRKFFADTRAKGATPILVTVIVRNIWSPGPDGKLHIERDMGYRDYDMQLAAAEHVALIDMATVAADKFEMLGPDTTRLLFPIDHTHTTPVGAEMNAASVVTALKNANSPLMKYMVAPKAPTY